MGTVFQVNVMFRLKLNRMIFNVGIIPGYVPILKKLLLKYVFYCSTVAAVVRVTDSWSIRQEFDPGTAEDSPCRRDRWTLNMLGIKSPRIGVV
ncbi:hypothetical protein TNCV_4979001 [Trichonephila clavipes]|nr:hypothetical protein TNCV_4979001 [Trichonephila clavipes]